MACASSCTTLDAALEHAGAADEVWVYGYASLIWRPEFDAVERRAARLHGWHRALRMRSRINRGTPETPGLVFALLRGGSCRGAVYRLCPQRWRDELPRLWAREMPLPVYEPRWLNCHTDAGVVRALSFTLRHDHPNHTGALSDESLIETFRHARGRYGTTLDYLLETQRGLHAMGIEDREVDRLVALARRAGLVPQEGSLRAAIA